MIIEREDNTSLHVVKDDESGKYFILINKNIEDGHHKTFKLVANNFHTFGKDSHSIEIEGVHYAVSPDVDIFAMASRISKSRNYRKLQREAA